MSWRPFLLSAVLIAFALAFASPQPVSAAPLTLAPIATDRCEALTKADFTGIQDAPTRLYKAKVVPANGSTPAYCHVTGYVSPQVGFDLKLPMTGWNKRILGIGCGGLCGDTEVFYDILPRWKQPLEHGYVTFGTDMGHHGKDSQDGIWAIDNLGGLIDFFHRATHVSTLAVKVITERFYGEPIRYSYFWGDSTGGRQAMMEAEKYPEDYDGVVARCPAIDQIDALQLTWFSVKLSAAFTDVANNAKKITLLADEAMKQCDALDGLKDGVIQDPTQCHVNLKPLLCRSGQSGPSCLTPGEVAAVEDAYRGPHTSKGEAIASGLLPGSEADWIGRYLTTDGGESFYYKFMKDWWRYIAFRDPEPKFEPSQMDYDKDVARLDYQRAMHNATDPDLRRFRDRGGKIIMLQGWGDTSVIPGDTVDFYNVATRTMGGPDATKSFFRLFMIPGVGHCDSGGLTGADIIDDLPPLEAWREKGEAPASLTAYRLRKYEGLGSFWPQKTPPDPANVAFSRPLYPYPDVAIYGGSGDPNAPSSFKAVSPPR